MDEEGNEEMDDPVEMGHTDEANDSAGNTSGALMSQVKLR
jgi:hypothetical protein